MSSNPQKGVSSHFWPILDFHAFFLSGPMPWDLGTVARVSEGCGRCTALPPPFCPGGRPCSLTTATWSPSGFFPRDGKMAHLEPHCPFVPTWSTVAAYSVKSASVFSEPSISHTSWVQNPVFKSFTCTPKFLMISYGPVFCLPSDFWSLQTTDCVSFVHLLSLQGQARLRKSTPCGRPSMAGGLQGGGSADEFTPSTARHRQY